MNSILEWASAFTIICVALSWLFKGVSVIKAPNNEQNKRLDEQEKEIVEIKKTLTEHEKLFAKDLHKFEAIENENHIELQALLALLEHGIDGNNVEQMKEVKQLLQNYLIQK
ncbi:MAG: hypothetical protein IJN59_04460 [Oscillospiraceae bacterium]|nr:hypothetical protein [Oscillospiraceae bacterium]